MSEAITTSKKQDESIRDIFRALVGNHRSPSVFLGVVLVKKDPHTKSILARLAFEEHFCYVWLGVSGAVRDSDGNNLRVKGQFGKLPGTMIHDQNYASCVSNAELIRQAA